MADAKTTALPVQLQDRDFSLLLSLFESRVMTASHLSTICFEGKREYAKKRLQKLKTAGLIGERTRRSNEPSILSLTRKGFGLLNIRGHLAGYPPLARTAFDARTSVSELTLRHELEVMDVKAALHGALFKSEQFSILQFSTWPLLCQFEVARATDGVVAPTKPDGFIRIHEKEEGTKGFAYDCFLEVDRSSEVQDTLVAKADCYREYYKSGAFAARNGASPRDFKAFPFRVLMIFKTAERRNNTAERLLAHSPPILTQVWLTTHADLTADPLGPIWVLPADFRKVIMGSQFDGQRPKQGFGYRRQGEREAFIESNVRKRRLLEGKVADEPVGSSG